MSINFNNIANSEHAIFLPAAAMALWSIIVILMLARARVAAVSSKKVKPSYYKLHHDKDAAAKGQIGGEPLEVAQISQHVENLFETPQLFYAVVCVLFFLGEGKNVMTLGAAWAYFGARFIHSLVSLGSNNVTQRFASFALSLVVCAGLWIRVVALVLME